MTSFPPSRLLLLCAVAALAPSAGCGPDTALDAFGAGSSPTGGSGGATTSSSSGDGGATTTGMGGGTTSSGVGGDPTGTGGTGGAGPGCGDGVVNGAEQCDDGNASNGDGCSTTCAVELSDGCPSVDLVLGTTPVTFMGDTTIAQNDMSGSCGGTSAGDYIFSIQPSLTGTLTATLQGSFSSANQKLLWIQPQCPADQFQSLACTSGSPAQLTFPVTQGMPFYLGVDGSQGAEGQFQLTLVIQ